MTYFFLSLELLIAGVIVYFVYKYIRSCYCEYITRKLEREEGPLTHD